MPLLGNVVISKNFLRTRNIMVMHSNERGECCPRTLVDRQRKRYHNAVDVVVRLHDPTDQVPNARHLRVQHTFSPMTSLELLIQEAEGEFCQHNGVMTVMMKFTDAGERIEMDL